MLKSIHDEIDYFRKLVLANLSKPFSLDHFSHQDLRILGAKSKNLSLSGINEQLRNNFVLYFSVAAEQNLLVWARAYRQGLFRNMLVEILRAGEKISVSNPLLDYFMGSTLATPELKRLQKSLANGEVGYFQAAENFKTLLPSIQK